MIMDATAKRADLEKKAIEEKILKEIEKKNGKGYSRKIRKRVSSCSNSN